MTAILIRAIDFAQIRSVAEALVARQVGIDLHAPQQVGPRSGRLLPERVAEEASIGQAQHARANMGDHVLGQYYLSLVVRTLGGAKKDWVPHSTSETKRSYGKALLPRAAQARPNTSLLLAWSGTSSRRGSPDAIAGSGLPSVNKRTMVLAVLLLGFAPISVNTDIAIRYDVDDARYLELGEQLPAVVAFSDKNTFLTDNPHQFSIPREPIPLP